MSYEKKHVQAWLDSLKIALLEQDAITAYELTQNLPFIFITETVPTTESTQNEAIESANIQATSNQKNHIQDDNLIEYLQMAQELITQSIALLESKKNETLLQLDRIRQAKKFLL
ncbi:hypothetical protein CQA44_11595 [Helicobacter sp. MIT 14-3879]|nr:hypothetical protein CQA44_11595 [Helicobacter sp. MIT 14-3879]